MSDFVSPPATETEPDTSTCRNCGRSIAWDDYSYTHNSTGFADCDAVVTAIDGPGIELFGKWYPDLTEVEITLDGTGRTSVAEPIEWTLRAPGKEAT